MTYAVFNSDCIEFLKSLDKNSIDLVDEIYLTSVDLEVTGDNLVRFPQIDVTQWNSENLLESISDNINFRIDKLTRKK